MGLTGVIYAAIVIGWAVFLVPLALRRHDRAARNHSIEKFSSAMRVLSRRRPDDEPVAADRGETPDRVVTPTLAVEEPEPVAATPRPTRAAMRAAAARRRRVLSILLVVAGVVVALWAFGYAPAWATAIPVALIVAFLVVARRQVRLADERYWAEVAQTRPEPSNVVRRRGAARVDASHGVARDDDEPTVTLTREQIAQAAAAIDEEIVEAVAYATADGSSLWDPLPVTLPTYVDKPVAQRSYRTIDLDADNVWSSARSTPAEADAEPVERDGATAWGEAVADDEPKAANA